MSKKNDLKFLENLILYDFDGSKTRIIFIETDKSHTYVYTQSKEQKAEGTLTMATITLEEVTPLWFCECCSKPLFDEDKFIVEDNYGYDVAYCEECNKYERIEEDEGSET